MFMTGVLCTVCGAQVYLCKGQGLIVIESEPSAICKGFSEI